MNWNRITAIMLKSWHNNKRNIFRLFDIFYWPAFELFVWGLFSMFIAETSTTGINITTILLGAVILWTFFNRASRDVSLAMTDELWSRNFVNLFSTPLKVGEYLIGVGIVALIKLFVSITFMFFLANTLYGFQIVSLGSYIIPAAFGLILFGWTLSFIVQGCIMRFGHTVEVFIWAMATLMQPLSCVFYPMSTLPPWAQSIALFIPSSYLFENMRQTMAGKGVNMEQLAISYGLNILYFILGLIFFYRSFTNAKQSGNLIKSY